ncbi:MAG TPA: ParB/RepB/Spo0J family partition protein [Phycisphaerales bacterium]|nr:ParB/RepB/Spo0J family partition protein [Phycisphaerales bacterium]HMP38254.1 ParB/RepB/Spo0J family partition protein [Phycisphaerales bacterium]
MKTSYNTQSATSPRRLGRGLGALLAGGASPPPRDRTPAEAVPDAVADPDARRIDGPSTVAAAAASATASADEGSSASASALASRPANPAPSGLVEIPPSSIVANARQPRQHFDEGALVALAESIRTAGVMQPVIVRPAAESPGRYELVAGERRWRAAMRLNLERIPAIVRTLDDRETAEWALIENLQREDLNPMDRAQAFRRLVDDFGMTHAQLAERLGVDRSSITNLLRLNDLDTFTSDAVRSGHLGLGHAKALLSVAREELRRALATQAIRNGWSVRRTERAVTAATKGAATSGGGGPREASPAALHRADLERRLGEWLGTRVTLEQGGRGRPGRLMLEFYSIEQFDGLLQRLGVPESVLRGE